MKGSVQKTVLITALIAFVGILSVSIAAAKEKVTIFHAGSLTVPFAKMEKIFEAKYPNIDILREPGGSTKMARMISELHKPADIMASADFKVIDKTLIPEYATWNIRFATNQLVLCYTDTSRFAKEVNADNWYKILERKGVVWGHSDPNLDPCGYRSLMVLQLAEKFYGQSGLYDKLIANRPKENIRPKSVELVSLLKTGNMDYAWEYRSVAVQHGMKFVELPDEINLSLVEQADFYSQATVEIAGKEPGATMTMTGKPIVYGVTIPKNALSPDLALDFIKFLLGPEGQAVMAAQGQPPIVPPVASDVDAVPDELEDIVTAASAPAAPAADAALSVTGAVENELALSRGDLEEMGAEEVTVEHPKKGEQTYEGVRLSKILEAASPTGATLTFTADDGYSVDLALADAQACADCLVAFDGDSLRMAMPGMESNFWVKGVVALEVK